jgi:hypothetical protein
MACNSITLNGIGLGCKDHMGGIKEVYLIKEDDVISVGTVDDAGDPVGSEAGTAAKIGSIELKESAKFKTYKFRKGTSSFTSTMTTDESIGTLSVQTDLSLQFSTMETAKRLEIMAMCMDAMKGIVLDSNGKYWFLGLDYPISASAASAETGVNFGDFGGYKVTLTDNSKQFPFELSEEAITALKQQLQEAPVA